MERSCRAAYAASSRYVVRNQLSQWAESIEAAVRVGRVDSSSGQSGLGKTMSTLWSRQAGSQVFGEAGIELKGFRSGVRDVAFFWEGGLRS